MQKQDYLLKEEIRYADKRPGLYFWNSKINEWILKRIWGSRLCLRFISINTGKIPKALYGIKFTVKSVLPLKCLFSGARCKSVICFWPCLVVQGGVQSACEQSVQTSQGYAHMLAAHKVLQEQEQQLESLIVLLLSGLLCGGKSLPLAEKLVCLILNILLEN